MSILKNLHARTPSIFWGILPKFLPKGMCSYETEEKIALYFSRTSDGLVSAFFTYKRFSNLTVGISPNLSLNLFCLPCSFNNEVIKEEKIAEHLYRLHAYYHGPLGTHQEESIEELQGKAKRFMETYYEEHT